MQLAQAAFAYLVPPLRSGQHALQLKPSLLYNFYHPSQSSASHEMGIANASIFL